MKKTIALALVLISLLALCSCGGSGTKLTKDNLTTYFNVKTGAYQTGDLVYGDRSPHGQGYYTCAGYEKIKVYCKLEPISSNFTYSGVEVVIRVSGNYMGCDDIAESNDYGGTVTDYLPKSFSETITVKVDISGKGEGYKEISVESGKLVDDSTKYTLDDYQIVSVKGTVEK